MQIIRTPRSRQDVAEIWHYIALDNERAANKQIDAFDKALDLLSGMPGMARLRPEFGSGIRGYPVGNYLMYFQTVPGGIELLRVFHGARNIQRLDET